MNQPTPELQIIVTLLAVVNELQKRVDNPEAENKELSARLNASSRNSSKPRQYQLVPYKRVSQFFTDIFGLEVSPGSICTFQKTAYPAVSG